MCKTHRLAHKAAARREGYVPKKRTKRKLSPPPVMGVSVPAPNLIGPPPVKLPKLELPKPEPPKPI